MTKGNMNRRTMLRGAALGALATPALVGKGIAQGKVNWRVQAHWPKASSSFTDSLGKLDQFFGLNVQFQVIRRERPFPATIIAIIIIIFIFIFCFELTYSLIIRG